MGDFNPAHAFDEAKERAERLDRGDRLTPALAAIIAVLAALGSLFAHHNSTAALSQKNDAILAQARSADQYSYYEASRIKSHIYQALIAGGVVRSASAIKALNETANNEDRKAHKAESLAMTYEEEARDSVERSERFMRDYESGEIATTFFEVSIVLVSLTALTRTRILLLFGVIGAGIGLVFLIWSFIT